MPLITATHMPSASEWRWWPEMDTGGALAEYMRTPPSDTAQFYAIRSWQRTPHWGGDLWDESIPGYVDDAVAGKLRGKQTPAEISRKLQQLADETEQFLQSAQPNVSDPHSAEYRATECDLNVLAQLARYHAAKKLAAMHLAFFEVTQQKGRLPKALEQAQAAASAWRRIVEITDGFYYDDLVFGILRGTAPAAWGNITADIGRIAWRK